jgi:hypothetical protein
MLRTLPTAALAALLTLAGCSKGSEPEPGTPLEALVEFNRALGRGDIEAARRWSLPGELQEEILSNTFAMMDAARAFQAKVVATWGEAELRRFLEQPGAQLHIDFNVPEEQLARAQIQEMGAVAYARIPEGPGPFRIERTAEGWRVDGVGTDHPQEIEGIRMTQAYSLGLAQILRRAVEKADEEGMTAELLDLQLGRVINDHEEAFVQELQRRAAEAQAAKQSAEVGPAPPPR